jgi:copper transport protein
MSRFAALLLGLLLVLAVATGRAEAHAQLVASEPAEAAMAAAMPAELRLVFNEPVAVTRLALVAPSGAVLALEAHVTGATVTAAPPADAATGTYVLSYRVVSADGHPVGGTVVFAVGRATATGAAAEAEGGAGALAVLIVAVRALLIVSAALGVGAALFLAFARPDDGADTGFTWLPVAASKALMGLAPVALALQGADALGTGVAGAASLAALAAGAATSFAASALLFAAAGLAALLALKRPAGAAARALACLAVLLAAAAFGASGHASTAPPRPAMAFAVAIHAGLALLWIGSLWPLVRLLGREAPDALAILKGFSTVAMTGVGALLLTGSLLAVVQVGQSEALAGTTYGRILLLKLGLVAVLLSLALLHRTVMTPALERGEATAGDKLRRSIRLELGVGLVLLALVAGWRLTPPPRALQAAASTPVRLHLHGEAGMADVQLEPGRVGENRAAIFLQTPNFEALPAHAVTLVLQPAAREVEAIERKAVPVPEGGWQADRLPLAIAGRWTLRVEILIDDFTRTTIAGEIDLRP